MTRKEKPDPSPSREELKAAVQNEANLLAVLAEVQASLDKLMADVAPLWLKRLELVADLARIAKAKAALSVTEE